MEFPAALRNKINLLLGDGDIRALARAAEELSERYRDESGSGKRSAAGRRDILVYSAVRMPATFAAVSRALELALECFDGDIGSVLDVGAGTGAGSVAASLLTDCRSIVCLEREPAMIELGREFFGCLDIEGDWIRRDITDGITERADLVICSYCLNELPEKRRTAAAEQLAEAAGKLLLIVEPGTPKAFAGLLKMRGLLIERGMTIAAPCPTDGECALAQGDWCHFTARAARSRLHKQLKGADVPYEDEKFCFLAAARGDARHCAGRVLRKPFTETGRITLNICSENGVSSEQVTRKSPLFKAARKCGSGDRFPS